MTNQKYPLHNEKADRADEVGCLTSLTTDGQRERGCVFGKAVQKRDQKRRHTDLMGLAGMCETESFVGSNFYIRWNISAGQPITKRAGSEF